MFARQPAAKNRASVFASRHAWAAVCATLLAAPAIAQMPSIVGPAEVWYRGQQVPNNPPHWSGPRDDNQPAVEFRVLEDEPPPAPAVDPLVARMQRLTAREMLEEALQRAARGEYGDALRFVRWAEQQELAWREDELNPRQVQFEIERLRFERERQTVMLATSDARLGAPWSASESPEIDARPDAASTPSDDTTPRIAAPGSVIAPAVANAPAPAPTAPTGETPAVVAMLPALVGCLVGAAVCMLTSAGVLMWLGPRWRGGEGGVFRIELVDSPHGVAARTVDESARKRKAPVRPRRRGGSDEAATGDDHHEASAPAAGDVDEFILPFTPGVSSYQQKQQQKQQERSHREQAILEVLYRQNLVVRERLAELNRAA